MWVSPIRWNPKEVKESGRLLSCVQSEMFASSVFQSKLNLSILWVMIQQIMKRKLKGVRKSPLIVYLSFTFSHSLTLNSVQGSTITVTYRFGVIMWEFQISWWDCHIHCVASIHPMFLHAHVFIPYMFIWFCVVCWTLLF